MPNQTINSHEQLRVVVVDDTLLYRTIISEILTAIPGVEVVGTASQGEIGIAKAVQLDPDLITLDVEMPVMDGLTTLKKLQEIKSRALVLMVSAHTRQGAAVTLEALQLGAYDFITKPEGDDPQRNFMMLAGMFRPIINAVMAQKILRQTICGMDSNPLGASPAAAIIPHSRGHRSAGIKLVAIGISTGGPVALADLLPRLPADFPVPIVIVQHMPRFFTGALAESLDSKCAIRVVEGQDGQVLQAATAYIAPGSRQMRVARGQSQSLYVLEVNDDPPENHCQPSADYLFRSVASVCKGQSLGVIMTGMGCDGTHGLRLMKRQGAQVIAQDQASCVVYGMPMAAVKAGVVDAVIPLTGMGPEIMRRVK
ncbi:MAG: chemotaxis response regulator protein-glutamate methylesterase [Desulfurivibrio sp.]|nr:MAG: chemotaxis response regulator protein-glutamate methylesterase [Desulfurivibrio sp.]